LLFSYGTLQREDVQLRTFGRKLRGERDALVGYQVSQVPITDPEVALALGKTHHDNALHDGACGSRLTGTVFEVSDAELVVVDAYEQQYAYRRVMAALASDRQAWVYVHQPHAVTES
jgi:gamma-glutamylcyclotransferase (GGCT)/AIG2-like uncharacterized protein YtfP